MTTAEIAAGHARTLDHVRAVLRDTGRLAVEPLIAHMRDTGRTELVHYAGAAHRDRVAWALCLAYLDRPSAPESELKSWALQMAWDIRRRRS